MVESDGTAMVELTLLGRIPPPGNGSGDPNSKFSFLDCFFCPSRLAVDPNSKSSFLDPLDWTGPDL